MHPTAVQRYTLRSLDDPDLLEKVNAGYAGVKHDPADPSASITRSAEFLNEQL